MEKLDRHDRKFVSITDTINAAIEQAKNEKCEPFSIYNDKEQVH